MRTTRGFTLLEIMISVCMLLLVLALAVPSVTGVIADKRLRQSLDDFNRLVRQAQERSVSEHRAYLIVWHERKVVVRPESFAANEPAQDVAEMALGRGQAVTLSLPSALVKEPLGEWIFWPSGTCEPAVIQFKGPNGIWTANYSPLAARAELIDYVAR